MLSDEDIGEVIEKCHDILYAKFRSQLNRDEIRDIMMDYYANNSQNIFKDKDLSKEKFLSIMLKFCTKKIFTLLKKKNSFIDLSFLYDDYLMKSIKGKIDADAILEKVSKMNKPIFQKLLEGKTFEQIGIEMNMKTCTIYSRYEREIKHLRKIFHQNKKND